MKNDTCIENIPVINMRKCVTQMCHKGYLPKVCEDWPLSAYLCLLFQDMSHLGSNYYIYEYVVNPAKDSILSEKTDFRSALLTFLSFELNLFPIKNEKDNIEIYKFFIHID